MMMNDDSKNPLIPALREAVKHISKLKCLNRYKIVMILVDPDDPEDIKVGIASDSDLTKEEAKELQTTLPRWLKVVARTNKKTFVIDEDTKMAVAKILRQRNKWLGSE